MIYDGGRTYHRLTWEVCETFMFPGGRRKLLVFSDAGRKIRKSQLREDLPVPWAVSFRWQQQKNRSFKFTDRFAWRG